MGTHPIFESDFDCLTDEMSDGDNEVVAEIDIGHEATCLETPDDSGLTHQWTIYLRGKEGGKIEKYIKSVTFKLHETFPNPNRVLDSVPFQITESGYAGFLVPIEIVFRNGLTTELKYELQLLTGRDCNAKRTEQISFQNPDLKFRKILVAGGCYSRRKAPPKSPPALGSKSKPVKSEKSEKKSMKKERREREEGKKRSRDKERPDEKLLRADKSQSSKSSRDSEKQRDRLSEKSSSDRKEKKQKRDKDRLSNIDGDSNADNESDQRRLEKRIKEKEERKKQKEKMRRSEGVSLEMKEKLKKDKRKTIATSDGKESHRTRENERVIEKKKRKSAEEQPSEEPPTKRIKEKHDPSQHIKLEDSDRKRKEEKRKRRKERESGRESLSKSQLTRDPKIKEEKETPEYPPIPKVSIKREPRGSNEYRHEYRAESRKAERPTFKKEIKIKEEPKSDFKHAPRIANKDISDLSDKASVTSSPANSMPQTPISSAHSYGRSPAMSNSHKSPFADAPKHRSPATDQHELPKAPSRASNLENLPSDDGELSDSNSSDSDSPIDSSSSDESDEFTVDMDFIQKKFTKFAEDDSEIYDDVLRKIMNIVFANYELLSKSSERYCENEADLQFDLTLLPKPALIRIQKFISEEIRS